MKLCMCGHEIDAHEHYGRWWSRHCALCACEDWHPPRWWRPVARVALQIAGGVAVFAVAVTAGAWAVHGLVLLIRAIP